MLIDANASSNTLSMYLKSAATSDAQEVSDHQIKVLAKRVINEKNKRCPQSVALTVPAFYYIGQVFNEFLFLCLGK